MRGRIDRLNDIIRLITHANPFLIYLIVAIFLLLESSAVPIINSTLLLFTGALVSLGHLNFWVLAIAAILGSISGACLAYIIGLRGGRRLFLRLAGIFRVSEQKVDMAERWFQKTGIWMVFLARIIPYIRPFGCFPAGISRMPFARFFIAALAGSTIWCIGMLYLGWLLGSRWRLALHLVQTYTIPTIGALVLLIGLYFLIKYVIKRYLPSRLWPVPDSVNNEDEHDSSDLLEV
jgi:membrane protein DedA with SNARE-associated domain